MSIATFRATDDTYYLGWALRMLGRDLIMQGRLEEAREALDEGLTMLTNIVDCDLDALRIGDRVEVSFKPAEGGFAIPMFKPA